MAAPASAPADEGGVPPPCDASSSSNFLTDLDSVLADAADADFPFTSTLNADGAAGRSQATAALVEEDAVPLQQLKTPEKLLPSIPPAEMMKAKETVQEEPGMDAAAGKQRQQQQQQQQPRTNFLGAIAEASAASTSKAQQQQQQDSTVAAAAAVVTAGGDDEEDISSQLEFPLPSAAIEDEPPVPHQKVADDADGAGGAAVLLEGEKGGENEEEPEGGGTEDELSRLLGEGGGVKVDEI